MGRYTIGDSININTYDAGYYSYANYAKDSAIMAAAGLIGCLYGAAASVVILAGVAAISTLAVYSLASSIVSEIGSSIMRGSPSRVASTVVAGAAIGAIGVTVAVAMIALTAIATPLIMLESAIKNAQIAGNSRNAGLLERIFGNFRAVSSASNQMYKFTKENIDKMNRSAKPVD